MLIQKAADGFQKCIYNVLSCWSPQPGMAVPIPVYLDPFRSVPFRSLGHCSAVGEASKYHYSEDVNDILNHVATSYMLTHAVYQAYLAKGGKASVRAFFDSLIFDAFASAIIPCFLTFYVTRVTAVLLREISAVPAVVLRWGPMIVGVAAVVFTHESIDRCVDRALDETLRSLY